MIVKNNNIIPPNIAKEQFPDVPLDKTTKDILAFIITCLKVYQAKYLNQGKIDETIQNGNLLTIMEKKSKDKFYHCRNEYAGAKTKGMETKIDIGIIEITANYDATLIFSIECKRLRHTLNPKGKLRPDKSRQYVIVKKQNTGGIQRFKEESHAPTVSKSAIVGYLEDESFDFWFQKVNEWIDNEAKSDKFGFWNRNDKIKSTEIGIDISQYQSEHNRRTQPDISLYHFWVKMF